MPEFRTIDLNPTRLHYAEAPGPGPALVILHGLSGSHAEFVHLLPELSRLAHVYLLDLRGHGLSGRGAGAYQLPDYSRDVAAFLRQVVARPALVVGHSLGGLVAVWLAGQAPCLVRGLLLSEPGLYLMQRFEQSAFYLYFSDLQTYLPRYQATGAALAEMVAYVGQAPVDEERTLLEVAGPEAVRERALQLHQLDPATLDPALTGTLLAGHDLDDLLTQVRCPIHLLAAEVALTAQDAERAISQLAHGTYTVIPNSGHDIHLDQPAAFVRELRCFLNNIHDFFPLDGRSL